MSAAPDAEPAGPVLTPDPDDGGVPDGWEFHRNGTATAHVDHVRYRLRRPKAGEYRRLRESLEEVTDAISDRAVELQARAAEIGKRAEEGQKAAEESGGVYLPSSEDRALERKLVREFRDEREAAYGDWMGEVFGLLCDQAVPAQDDLPVWWTAEATATALFRHWQTVPPARGVR